MGIFSWALAELISYGIWPWAIFFSIAIASAYLLRSPGIVLSVVLIAALVVALDVEWIQSEMRKPGWNGQPDQDFVFMLGVAARVLLVNVVLYPASLIALRLRRLRESRRAAQSSTLP